MSRAKLWSETYGQGTVKLRECLVKKYMHLKSNETQMNIAFWWKLISSGSPLQLKAQLLQQLSQICILFLVGYVTDLSLAYVLKFRNSTLMSNCFLINFFISNVHNISCSMCCVILNGKLAFPFGFGLTTAQLMHLCSYLIKQSQK